MPVPQQLSQISILWIRHPDSRKSIFRQQLPHKSGIFAVGLVLLDSLARDLRGSPIHTSNPNSASGRSNQREYPVASIPTRTQIPRCFRSRVVLQDQPVELPFPAKPAMLKVECNFPELSSPDPQNAVKIVPIIFPVIRDK